MKKTQRRISARTQTILSICVALGIALLSDALVYTVPHMMLGPVSLRTAVVAGACVAATVLLILASLASPAHPDIPTRLGEIEIRAGGLNDPTVIAAILDALAVQIVQQQRLQESMNEQRVRQAELADSIKKFSDYYRMTDNSNLRLQLILAAVTTMIGVLGGFLPAVIGAH